MNPTILNQTSQIKPLFDYLKKQQDNQKFLKYVEITATFTLIIFFMLFAIKPTVLTISSLVGEINSKKILKQELKTKINNIVQAQDQFSMVQGKYQIIDSSLPDRPRYFQAAEQIQKTSTDSGIAIDKYNFNLNTVDTNLPDPNLKLYTLSLDMKGQFLPAVNIATELLDNRRLINIGSINFNSNQIDDKQASPSAGTSGGVSTVFSTTFYYWPTVNEKK